MYSDLMARDCAGQKTDQGRRGERLDDFEGWVQNQIVMQIQRLLQIALVSGVALVGLPALGRGFSSEALPSSAGSHARAPLPSSELSSSELPSSELPASGRPSPVDSAVPSSPQYGDDDGDGDGDGDGDDGDGSGDDDGSEAQPLFA